MNLDHLLAGAALVFEPRVLGVMLIASFFGLFVGATPGLTATMAVALLVPVTFFMDPSASLAAIIAVSAMAIFAGDIPSALLRIPGTPASAAYVDDAFLLTRRGRIDLGLGVNLVTSVLGGVFGAVVLMLAAPLLADIALRFSTYEYFFLALLGLACAVIVSRGDPLKGTVSMLLGLVMSTVGIDVVLGFPRLTFGFPELLSGIDIVPALVGVFAISELCRKLAHLDGSAPEILDPGGSLLGGVWGVVWKFRLNFVRGSAIGTLIGALPGAGADIAAWISYAVSKKFSKNAANYGNGEVEGLVDAGAANNAALGGAWVPALVFGIPGDTITAILIGVLFMKGLNPGPTIFERTPELVSSIYIAFIVANVLMLPLGILAIRAGRTILAVPTTFLYPLILMACIVGSFAVANSAFAVGLMLVLGLAAWVLEENDFPMAPLILGLVLGRLVEE
ncbi:MAG: tripartite tricarboxylate transporter permease, partial [Acetobacteraceae bacterium]|nr:tripartite tricarboxylate transporter permease [Acetobacteraceae bacterium]